MPWLRWPVATLVIRRRRSLLRFFGVANGVCRWRCRWRRRSLRFVCHMTASLTASPLLRCKRHMPVAPSVPSLRSPHDGVAHCPASPASQITRACGAVGPFASLVTWRRRALLRVSCDANGVCLGSDGPGASLVIRRRRSLLRFSGVANDILPLAPSVPSLRSSHDSVAFCFASLALQTTVPVAPSAPSLRSSHGGVALCFAPLALQTTYTCGAVGSFASLVTRRRRTLPHFSCAANGVCPWRRRSIRVARHMKASLSASLLLRRKRCVPVAPSVLRFDRHTTVSLIASLPLRRKQRVRVAPSVPSPRSSHGGVAHWVIS